MAIMRRTMAVLLLAGFSHAFNLPWLLSKEYKAGYEDQTRIPIYATQMYSEHTGRRFNWSMLNWPKDHSDKPSNTVHYSIKGNEMELTSYNVSTNFI